MNIYLKSRCIKRRQLSQKISFARCTFVQRLAPVYFKGSDAMRADVFG
jgi:hypothetical protein